jgi:Methyltransferase domain
MQTFAADRLPYTIECISDEFFRRWSQNERAIDVFGRPVTLGGGLSFCYIDGNHTYEFAKRDFENTDRMLVSGGFILFDDSADGSHWEVNQLTREIAAGHQYELISKNPNYLFKKK